VCVAVRCSVLQCVAVSAFNEANLPILNVFTCLHVSPDSIMFVTCPIDVCVMPDTCVYQVACCNMLHLFV